MKQLLQFKTFLLLAIFSLLTGTQAWGADETISFSGTNGVEMGTITQGDLTITWNKGTNSNPPKWYDSGSAVRCYGGNSMTVTSSGSNIAEITITFGSSDGTNAITTDVGTWSSPTWTGDASSVTFTVGGTKGNRRIQKVDVTYAAASGDTRVATTTTFPQSAYTVELGEAFTAPTATVNDPTGAPISGAVVTYSSDNTSVAMVDATTGAVTIVAAGTANITASYDGDETAYKPSTGSYTLVVTTIQNISDITAAGTYTVRGTIVAKSQRGFVVGDGTGYVYYYNASYDQSSYNVGDIVQLSGSVVVYGGVYEFNNTTTVTSATVSNYVAEDPTVLSGADMDALVASGAATSLSNFVQYEGTLSINGTHYNITNIDGATTAQGSISYPLNTDFTSLNGQKVVVKGYFVGVSSSTYYNTLISSVEEYTDPTDSRIATTITQDDITLDIAEVATLTKITPVVKDVDGNVISYVNSEFPPEVSFTVESDENSIIGGFDWNTGDITLNPIAGTATVKAYYNSYDVNTTYKPSECTFTITVVDSNAPGGMNNPYSVEDAIAAIDAGSGTTGVYVTGTVSKIVTAFNSAYGNISYNISDDGTTTSSQLQAFRGKSYNGENFTSADDIKVGDIVVVYGNLTKYNTTYEFAQDNQLVSLQRPAAGPTFNPAAGEVAYETEVTITADEGNTLKYTTDGTDPATSETAVTTTTNTAVVTIYQDTEIRAIAYSASGAPSAEASAYYTVAVRTPDAPVITPAGGGVEAGTVVTVSYSDPESTLLVTTDGSDPAEMGETVETYDFVTNADLEENGTLTVSYTINAATTIRAIVMDNVMGGLSAETTADFTIDLPTPTFQMLNDISGYTVKGNTIYSGEDASIQVYVIGSTNFATWYTLDGSDPTTSTTVKKITAATMNQRINMFHMPGVAVTLNQDGQTLRAATYDAANNAFGPVADWGYTIKIGNPVVAAGTYAKVTSNADIEAGKNYILVYEDETAPQVFTGEISTTKTPYGLNVETTYSDVNEINISELTVTPVVIEADATSGYNLKVGEQYLAWESGNSLKLQDDAYAWTIEVEDTEAKSSIASVATPERFLQYNTSSPRFACYTGSQKAVAIYKEVPASEAFEMLPITITSAGYSTLYYSDKDIELPATGNGMTVRAYTMTFDGKKISEGDEFVSGDKIPAGTAVVLEEYNHEAITFEAKAYAPTIVANPSVENFLYGFDDDTDLELVFGAEGLKFYKLSGSPSGVIGFYWAKDNGAPFVSVAHKAALVLPADAASGIRGFDLADGTPTAIKNVETSAAADGKIYDLQGRRVMNAQKGIYIINGKKVIK